MFVPLFIFIFIWSLSIHSFFKLWDLCFQLLLRLFYNSSRVIWLWASLILNSFSFCFQVNCLEPHPQIPFLCTSGLDYDVKVWVPSNEQEPSLAGLSETVKMNMKSRAHWTDCYYDLNDSRMLWMLWRQLSRSEQIRVSQLSNK